MAIINMIIAILEIVPVLIGLLSGSPLPSLPIQPDTISWSTFTDSRGIYQVAYPPGWTIVDETYFLDSGPVIGFRADSAPREIGAAAGRPAYLSAYFCYSAAIGAFDDHCYGSGSESIEFVFVGHAGDQAVDEVPLTNDELLNTPEFPVAKTILARTHLISDPDRSTP